MPSKQDRYSGDIARFIALNIVSVGGGKVDLDSLPYRFGSWDLEFINPSGVELWVYDISYKHVEDLLISILGNPYFRNSGEAGFRNSNFASSNFDCEIKLSETPDHLKILIH